jgi:hypothetical protein
MVWRLILEALLAFLYAYNRLMRRIVGPEQVADNFPRCRVCGGHWHGLRDSTGCPGVYATPGQEEAYYYARANGLIDL